MFPAPSDDFLEMLMSGKGQEYLDKQIAKVRQQMGEKQFQEFAQQYFKRQGQQNIYANPIKHQPGNQSDEKWLTNQPQLGEVEIIQQVQDNLANRSASQIKNATFLTQSNPNQTESIHQKQTESEEQFAEVSRELIQGTHNNYRITYNNGDFYEGQSEGSAKMGWGTYYYHNGQKFDGCFIDDQIHGYGHYYFLGGAEYEGDWSSGMKHGIGILKFANNDVYEGAFCRDQFHGCGKYRYYNGDVFEGKWKMGTKNGKGRFEGKDGALQIGTWVNGAFQV